MNNEEIYLYTLNNVYCFGQDKEDRTGTGTRSDFGVKANYSSVEKEFPLLTTKYVSFKNIVTELLWFLKGDTNIKYLQDNNCHIWDEWADKNGNLGPIYGYQWRSYASNYVSKPIDQIAQVIDQIKTNPNSRRLIVNCWNPEQLNIMALPPCHVLFQFYVRENKYLDLQLYQRSADMFLGVPYNIASYSLLLAMIAQVTGYETGNFYHVMGDAHIYLNHITQVELQLDRYLYESPSLKLNKDIKHIDDFKFEDIVLENYKYHPAIKAPVAV